MTYAVGSLRYELDEGWGRLPEGYEFLQVAGVATDGNDNVYVFSRGDHPLMVFDREGTLIKTWRRSFKFPHAAHVDQEGNVFLVDSHSHVVIKYSPDEDLLMTLGTRDQPTDTGLDPDGWTVQRAAGPFNRPAGVVVSQRGDIFVADGYGNARVHKFDADGVLRLSWGEPGKAGPGQFHLPHGIGLDNLGRVLVCDRQNHRIQLYSQDGEFLGMWTGFRQPTHVAVGPDGTVYVSELQGRVSILDGDGNVLARWGSEPSHEPGGFFAPHCVAVDSRGDLYIGEVLEGMRVQKFLRRQGSE